MTRALSRASCCSPKMAGLTARYQLRSFPGMVLLLATISYASNSSDIHAPCTEAIIGIEFRCMALNLSKLPDQLPATTQILDLSFNHLTILSPRYFARLPSLQMLDLTRCNIEVIEEEAFWGLQNLTSLFLTGNRLRKLSTKAFFGLVSLQKLAAVELNLSFLDDLPIENIAVLRELNIGSNKIESLKIPHFFTHLQSLEILDLHANRITSIKFGDLNVLRAMNTYNLTIILSRNIIHQVEPGTFWGIHLHKLSLRDSFSHAETLHNGLFGLAGLRVKELEIGCFRNPARFNFENGLLDGLCQVEYQDILLINFHDFHNGTDTLFDCLVNATAVRVVSSRLDKVTAIPVFTRIRHLEFKKCHLTEVPINQLTTITTLKVLRITNGLYLRSFEQLVEGPPNLLSLDLSQNHITISRCCLFIKIPSLQHLNLSSNSLIYMTADFFHLQNLLSLDFHHTKLVNFGTFPILFHLSNLLYLDLSDTGTHFLIDCPFCALENLNILKVSGNTFGDNSLSNSLGNLTELTFLDISGCSLEHVHPNTFSKVGKLRELHISNNHLTELDPAVFWPLKALNILDLSRNQIQALRENVQVALPRNLTSLDLSENPFDCSCTHYVFLQWVKMQESLLLDGSSMVCKSPPQVSSEKITHLDTSYCTTQMVSVVLPVSLILFSFPVSFIFYKCYFQHYYRLFLHRWCMDSVHKEDMYDAFVIYSTKDEEWVTGELVKKLEEGSPPFRLCLHFRDFMPGVPIASNIVQEGFLKSRKAIVVVSAHFMESKWCSFEFELAQSWQFLESKSGIIVVILEKVDKARLRQVLGLHRYLSRNTYLQWKANPVEQHLFWMQMRNALMVGKPQHNHHMENA
ncbi:toll-like receptor 4 [Ambystoma mexicanum]|uniref:toll-like receptor 4 n=1 Tax=Ambystoma mexicanum TaxID=8296 RepID=UPI0037E950A1